MRMPCTANSRTLQAATNSAPATTAPIENGGPHVQSNEEREQLDGYYECIGLVLWLHAVTAGPHSYVLVHSLLASVLGRIVLAGRERKAGRGEGYDPATVRGKS